jgi:hypothetical protein
MVIELGVGGQSLLRGLENREMSWWAGGEGEECVLGGQIDRC